MDLTNNIVTVYSTLDDSVVRQMICSGGMARYKSPRGTYTMPTQRKKFERSDWYTFEDGYGKFGSRIVGSYLFHSYLFHSKNDEDVAGHLLYGYRGGGRSPGKGSGYLLPL